MARYKYVGKQPAYLAGALRQPGDVFGAMQEDQHAELRNRKDVEVVPDEFDQPGA